VSERTEKATPKRREEARRRGQVARSTDVNTAAVLFGVTAALIVTAPRLVRELEAMMREGFARAADPRAASAGELASIGAWSLREFATAAGPVVLAAALAGVLANVAQVRLRITPQALKPSFTKLNPLKGIKNLFSKNGLVELAKALVKIAIVGVVAYLTIRPKLADFVALSGAGPNDVLTAIAVNIRGIFLRVAGAFAVIAAADYAWQRYRHEKGLRMSKQELKQEFKQSDLPTEVKRQIRRRQMEGARRRMLADVPTADVVVVNPTHYAVALRYDGSAPAPEVVAKGVDLVAAAIREVAQEHGVAIVSDPPLTRALYRDVDIGRTIPEEFFSSVAQVLAFVYRTARRRRPPLNSVARRSTTRAMPSSQHQR
jgi:flagellar biosynthetic protein FlhB